MIDFEPGKLHMLIDDDLFNVNDAGPGAQETSTAAIEDKSIPKTYPVPGLLMMTDRLSAADRLTLDKLIAAIDVVPKAVTIQNQFNEDYLKFERTLVFGFDKEAKDICQNLYTPESIKNIEIMRAAGMSVLEGDRNEKIRLWEALKHWYRLP